MTYDEIKNSVPEGVARKIKKPKPVGPKSVLIFFLITMLIFVVLGTLIQYLLGMVGVLITELFFLLVSILYVRWKGHRLKDVFPIKKPKFSALAGTFLLWIGSYMVMIIVNALVMAYFPDYPVSTDSETILSSGLNWFFLFFIVAIIPPICEEALHRGVLQYGMRKKINNPWLMALIIGLIFGAFHLDASKFLATGLLGGVMGWIMFRTDNLVYSSFFHFIHNGSQMVLMALIPGLATAPGVFLMNTARVIPVVPLTSEAADIYADTSVTLFSAGALTIFMGLFVPIILYTGNWLLMKQIAPRHQPFISKEKNAGKRNRKQLFIATISFVIIGILTMLASLLAG